MDHEFFQDPPELENTYSADPLLKKWFSKYCPPESFKKIEAHLHRCGEKAIGDWLRWSEDAEAHPPQLIHYNPWGKRIDQIKLSSGWMNLESECSIEGILATAYERKFGDLSRVYQLSLLYLFHPSSAFVSCPLAMTDGAARCLETVGPEHLKNSAFKNLTSRDPQFFWTSGQWMTERTGGSDVSGTSTLAKKSGTQFELYGSKWFTSSTHSQMAMLLARIEGEEGLSLFYTETRNKNGELNKILVNRLKDKLGTKALPTAELTLQGTPATLIGASGAGVKNISIILNITRIYNSVCATSHLRRGLDLLQSYSQKRKAFGKKLSDHPLHQTTLQTLELDWRRCFFFTFRMGHLLGKDEVGTISAEEKIELRCLTPVLKLYTAKLCVRGISEICEGFGGAGYIEDTGLPRLLRDAQVFSIWEGTTNVLSLDLLRALKKEAGAQDWFEKEFSSELLKRGFKIDSASLEAQARQIAMTIGELYADKHSIS